MDNYALYLLQNALRDEIIAKTDAVNYMLGNHAYPNSVGEYVTQKAFHATKKAFQESERLADERIPQLQKAIESMGLNDVMHEIRGALYDRDTDNEILSRIDKILTENGY